MLTLTWLGGTTRPTCTRVEDARIKGRPPPASRHPHNKNGEYVAEGRVACPLHRPLLFLGGRIQLAGGTLSSLSSLVYGRQPPSYHRHHHIFNTSVHPYLHHHFSDRCRCSTFLLLPTCLHNRLRVCRLKAVAGAALICH